MKIKTNFSYALNYFGEADCRIEKLVEASPEDFKELQISLQDNPLLLKHKDCMYEQDGVCHCLLVLEQEGYDGILVESKGPGYPFYGAYITGMWDVLNGELSRAADFIVRQCMENSQEGSWQIQFNDPPGRAHGYVPFNELSERFGLTIRPGNGLDAMLHGSFGLTLQEIRDHRYLSDLELENTCQVPRQVLEGAMPVRDVLALDGLPEVASLAHKNSVFLVPLEDLKLLTDAGKEDFAALLDARVADIRVDEETPELLLEGVEAAELDRLHDKLEAHKQAEQAMGPAMG